MGTACFIVFCIGGAFSYFWYEASHQTPNVDKEVVKTFKMLATACYVILFSLLLYMLGE